MSYLQTVCESKCLNIVIVRTRVLIMAYEILRAWTNLLLPVSSGWKSALELSCGLQKCFVPEAAGTAYAGGAGLDGLPALAGITVAVSCVLLTSVATELR